MNVSELIAALQVLEPDTPVSHELLAELAPVDESAIYGGGKSPLHPSIYHFRKQRYLRAAAAATRAIAKLRDAGWNVRVTRESIGTESRFVTRIDFVVTPNRPDQPYCGSIEDLRAAEELIRDVRYEWPGEIYNGWVITEEAHREQFDAARSRDDIEATLPPHKDVSVLSQELLRFADISAATRAYLLSRGPILYVDEAQFPGEIVREWPDGRKEFVQRNSDGELVVVREISNELGKES